MSFVTDTNGLSVQNSGYCHIINNISYSIYIYCVIHIIHKLHNKYKYCVIHNKSNKMKQELAISQEIVEGEQRYKRECKGRSLALTRNIYRLHNSDIYYVQSESSNDIYYFVKFKPDVVEYCSCLDNSLRGGQIKCKHLHAIGFAIRLGTLRDTERLPTEAKVSKVVVSAATVIPTAKSSYKDDDYSF